MILDASIKTSFFVFKMLVFAFISNEILLNYQNIHYSADSIRISILLEVNFLRALTNEFTN